VTPRIHPGRFSARWSRCDTDRGEDLRSEYREGEAPAEPGLRFGSSLAFPDTRGYFRDSYEVVPGLRTVRTDA